MTRLSMYRGWFSVHRAVPWYIFFFRTFSMYRVFFFVTDSSFSIPFCADFFRFRYIGRYRVFLRFWPAKTGEKCNNEMVPWYHFVRKNGFFGTLAKVRCTEFCDLLPGEVLNFWACFRYIPMYRIIFRYMPMYRVFAGLLPGEVPRLWMVGGTDAIGR